MRSFAARAAIPTTISPQPAMHALVLRSPHAHAKFTINVSKARGLPGVGADPDGGRRRRSRRPAVPVQPGNRSVHRPALSDPAEGRGAPCRRRRRLRGRRHASTRPATRSRRSTSNGRRCPRWSALANAVKQGAPQVWPDKPGNVLFDVPIGDKKATEAAFAKAHAVAEVSDRQSARRHQLHGNARRGRRIRRQARSSDADDRQPGQPSPARNPVRHGAEDPDGKDAGDLPRRRRRFRHQAVSLSRIRADRGRRAKAAARPVKWTADRADHFMGDAQGRDNVTTAKMALAEDGKFLGMDVDLMGDMGAYLSTFGPYIPHGGAGMLPGLYDIQAFHCRVRTVFTNTVPVDAYRGAGRPGSRLCDRAPGRCRRAQARHDAGCDPAQEFHPAEGDALQDRDRQGLRFRRLHRAHEARDGDRQLEGVSQARQGARRRQAWCAASASPAMSRSAAPWARRPPTSRSIPTATSPS